LKLETEEMAKMAQTLKESTFKDFAHDMHGGNYSHHAQNGNGT
jgi:hypothetical protein